MDAQSPLYLRMYFQKHMTDLVRIIGYDGLPVMEAHERLKPLIDEFGESTIREAADEIVDINASREPAFARLTPHARKLAVGILGRPPDEPFVYEQIAEHSASSSENSPDARVPPDDQQPEPPHPTVPVQLSRDEVLAQYRDWLTRKDPEFEEIDRKTPKIMEGVKLSTLDFVLHSEPKQLATVRRYLTARQREHMALWQKIYPAYRPVRIWPVETENGWLWEEFDVEIAS